MPVNKSELDKAISAALNGPEIRDVRFAEYRFNVKPAKIERSGDITTVVGGEDSYISRRRRARANDRIYYAVRKNATGTHVMEIDIDRGGVRRGISRALSDLLHQLRDLPLPPGPGPTIPPGERGSWFRLASLPSDEAISDELLPLLDGSWEAEAKFLVANIARHAR